jgi:hypothetical protein
VLAESEPAQAEAEENNQFAASEVTRIERVDSGAQVRVPPAALDEPDEETRLNGKASATPGVSVQAASGPRNTGPLKTAEPPASPRPTGTLKTAEPPASNPGRPTGTLPKASPPPAAPPPPASPRPTGTLKAAEPPAVSKAAEPPLAMSPEDTPTPPPLPSAPEDTPTPPPAPVAVAKSAQAKRSEPPKKARPEFETPAPRAGASFENEDDFAPTPSVVRMLKGKGGVVPSGDAAASSGGAWKNWVMAFLGLGLVGVSGAWAAWPAPKPPAQECPTCAEPPPAPPAECAEVAAALLPTNPPAGLVEVPLSLNPSNSRVMLFVDREWRYLKTGTSKLSLPKGSSVEVVVAAPGYFPERYLVDTSKAEGLKVALKEDPKASVKKKPGN